MAHSLFAFLRPASPVEALRASAGLGLDPETNL